MPRYRGDDRFEHQGHSDYQTEVQSMTKPLEDGLRRVAEDLSGELEEDYVGVWKLDRLLRERGGSSPERVVRLVSFLLRDQRVLLGQFTNDCFVAWTGEIDAQLHRLLLELQALRRPPDIGEVAWLARR